MIKVGDTLPNATLMEYSEVEGNGCSIAMLQPLPSTSEYSIRVALGRVSPTLIMGCS